MNKALMQDLRAGMGLEEALIKHKTNLKEALAMPSCDKPLDEKYIYRVNGAWLLKKQVNGKMVVFGTYDFLSEAKIVRRELAKYNWNKLKLGKILDEQNITFSTCNTSNNGNKFIQRLASGNYSVQKKFKTGKKTVHVYGGTYSSLEDARTIRDELIRCNWNDALLPKIKAETGIRNSKGE